jgi:hypothetical protein
VPPPPVTGATVGISVDGGTVMVTVAVATAVAVWVAGPLEVTPGVPEVVVLPEPGVVLPPEAGAVAVPVPEMVTDGEKVGTLGEDELEPEQADTATRATRVTAPQHRAVSLAPSAVPGIMMRTFM